MATKLEETHAVDADGNPAGGQTRGTGLDITWQDGPIGKGKEPNGASVEAIIEAAIGRLEFYQGAADGKFACLENAYAIGRLEAALAWLDKRTAKREARGVEGTNTP